MPVFEAIMLICFGVSWPVANWRTLRVKRVEGQSLGFMGLVLIGYLSGLLFNTTRTGGPSWIFFLYLFNLAMVSLAILLHLRYRTPAAPPAPCRG